jgi:SAM-dependent methyltransferase
MTGFSADWLALREPHDARARNPAVLNGVVASLVGNTSIRIVDLACGTGSTLRALAPRFPAGQNWRLADNDLSLLARASAMARPAGVSFTTVPLDLNRDLEAALDGPIDLVTTSALLDLVSEAWLDRLAVEVLARSLPIYAALSYDGRIEINPCNTLDAAIVSALNEHQRGDKGFGPALGPMAASAAIARFESLGCAVVYGNADWVVGPHDREFQMELFSGWASAARELGGLSLTDTVEWLTWRRDAAAAGRSSVRVGHVDIFAQPTGTR